MSEISKIEWTDSTFNPWVGCTKISPACDNCYAADWAARYGDVKWGANLVALAMLARHARTRLTVTKALAQTAYATPGQLERAAHAVEARTDPDFREKVVRAAGLIASALSEEV